MVFVFKNFAHFQSHRRYLYSEFSKKTAKVCKLYLLPQNCGLPVYLLYPFAGAVLAIRIVFVYAYGGGRDFVLNTIGPIFIGLLVSLFLPRIRMGLFFSGLGSAINSRNSYFGRLATKTLKLLILKAHGNGKVVVFVQNSEDRREILSWSLEAPLDVRIIPCVGVSQAVRAVPRSRKNLSVCRVTWVGRLIRDKGIFEYLDLVKELQVIGKSSTDFHFSLLGIPSPSSMNAIPEDVVSASCNTLGIEFVTGTKPGSDKFLHSDLLIFLSYREGFPLTVCEAVSGGCVVVGFNVPGTADALGFGSHGLLVNRGLSMKSLADKTYCLWMSDTYDVYRARGYEWAAKNLDIKINSLRQRSIIENALKTLRK